MIQDCPGLREIAIGSLSNRRGRVDSPDQRRSQHRRRPVPAIAIVHDKAVAEPRCAQQQPALLAIGAGQFAACHLIHSER